MTTIYQLRARLLRWGEDIAKKAQPEAVKVDRVDVVAGEIWTKGYAGSSKYTGSAELSADDKIYKSKGRSPGTILGIAWNARDNTRYPRMRFDYANSPGGTMVLSAALGELTIGAATLQYIDNVGTTYNLLQSGNTNDSLIWLEM